MAVTTLMRLLAAFLVSAAQLTRVAQGQANLRTVPGQVGTSSAWTPQFFSPQLTPVQFLFISSPTQGKIVYTELRNFQAVSGRTYALIDAGLVEPCGIAFDHERGALYVADRGAEKIFRYVVYVEERKNADGSPLYSLVTDGNRMEILTGHRTEWVSVNTNGDVFYSDQGTNSINKITTALMSAIADGSVQTENVAVVSERSMEAQASAGQSATLSAPAGQEPVTDPATGGLVQPSIYSIYEGSLNPHVTEPSGIATDGVSLFWGNRAQGRTGGALVMGQVNPVAPAIRTPGSQPAPFPAYALSNNTDQAYGVARSTTMVFFSSQEATGSGYVYGTSSNPVGPMAGSVYAFSRQFSSPRGLVWDGDQTVYVADTTANNVWSFPVGRHMENVPVARTVDFAGAYGLALLSASDPAFQLRSGALRASQSAAPVLLILIAALLAVVRAP